MVIGEPQILGQVKEAYQAAEAAGTLGSVLNALRNRSLAAAKRARTETGIGRERGVRSRTWRWSWRARSSASCKDKNVLLVGRGQDERAGRAAPRALRGAGHGAGRPHVRAGGRAGGGAGRPGRAPSSRCATSWRAADIVISGTGAPGIVIQQARRRGRARRAPRPAPRPAVPHRHRGARATSTRRSRIWRRLPLRPRRPAGRWRRRTCASVARRRRRRRRWSSARSREFLDWQKSLDAVPLLVELRAPRRRRSARPSSRRRGGGWARSPRSRRRPSRPPPRPS